jgi:phage terminase large subunit-like protein
VVGAMCMVRNSCGSNAYVSDEIITSRAGVRLRVVNTDAEGRMAMVDVLAHMKEKALNEVKKSFILMPRKTDVHSGLVKIINTLRNVNLFPSLFCYKTLFKIMISFVIIEIIHSFWQNV